MIRVSILFHDLHANTESGLDGEIGYGLWEMVDRAIYDKVSMESSYDVMSRETLKECSENE